MIVIPTEDVRQCNLLPFSGFRHYSQLSHVTTFPGLQMLMQGHWSFSQVPKAAHFSKMLWTLIHHKMLPIVPRGHDVRSCSRHQRSRFELFSIMFQSLDDRRTVSGSSLQQNQPLTTVRYLGQMTRELWVSVLVQFC